jgi:hypothetical protein
MSKELAVVEQAPVDTYRMSTDAAKICKEIVVSSSQDIKGKKYVRVEGWMAIALAHGCVASVKSVERVETGFRAMAEVKRMSDGMVLSTAEGFVGDDESTWASRAEYAKRAMAQTRAISRACRSAFAHVVVMMNAGLSTTPAEEVPDEGFHPTSAPQAVPQKTASIPPAVQQAFPEASHEKPKKSGKVISEPQRKRLFAIAHGAGWKNEELKSFLLSAFGVEHSDKIAIEDYESICEKVSAGAPLPVDMVYQGELG